MNRQLLEKELIDIKQMTDSMINDCIFEKSDYAFNKYAALISKEKEIKELLQYK